MKGYHCYVLNKEGKISRRHDIEAESDADAMIKGETVAADLSDEFPEIEVWREARLVGRLARQPSSGKRARELNPHNGENREHRNGATYGFPSSPRG